MTSCGSCGGQVGKVEGEEVCLSCGQLPPLENTLLFFAPHSDRFLGDTTLGSLIGSPNQRGTTLLLDGASLQLAQVRRRVGMLAPAAPAESPEGLTLRVAEKLGLSHLSMTEAVLVARQTYARSRKLGFKNAALSAHAILTALRRAGRTDIPVSAVIEAHRALGRNLRKRHLNRVLMEFPLPRLGREDYLTLAARRIFTEGSDPKLLGSVLTEAKAILASFEESSRSPRTLAATALYVAGRKLGAKLTQSALAEVVGVSEYSVRGAVAEYRRDGGV